jgi:hypothetical protein
MLDNKIVVGDIFHAQIDYAGGGIVCNYFYIVTKVCSEWVIELEQCNGKSIGLTGGRLAEVCGLPFRGKHYNKITVPLYSNDEILVDNFLYNRIAPTQAFITK